MSTGIQCLAATKSLKQYFLKTFFSQTMDESSLTVQFSELLQKMWCGQFSVVHPTKFKQALGTYYPQFKDCSQVRILSGNFISRSMFLDEFSNCASFFQHDCQEFLALLLDALHQQLVACSNEVSEEGDCARFKVSCVSRFSKLFSHKLKKLLLKNQVKIMSELLSAFFRKLWILE